MQVRTPKQTRKEVDAKPEVMTAGELAEFVKKSMITAYTNLVNGATAFDNYIAYFVALTDCHDALKNAINADHAQEAKLNAAFFDALNSDEVARQKNAFYHPQIQSHVASLMVEYKNVDVSKGLAKVGRDVKLIRRQVCTVEFSDGDRSVTCTQAELNNAAVKAKMKEQFDAKVKALSPVVVEDVGLRRRSGGM